MTARDTYWVGRDKTADKFQAMDIATARFWAAVGTDHTRYTVTDRTVIGAFLDDGRRGFVVGIEWNGGC